MAVRFFGQFLIERGDVDAAHIREALGVMETYNASLGDLAVEAEWITTRDAAVVNAAQRSRDVSFGDLAVEMGFLTTVQLVELVRTQHARRVPIGEALVELGHLTSDRLPQLLDAFKVDQAVYAAHQITLPDVLTNHRATRPLLILLPRFAERIGKMQLKVGEMKPVSGVPDFAQVRVSVRIKGAAGLDVALVSDAEFAEALAVATTGLDLRDLDTELVADGVGEFLNVLLGNAVSALSGEGHELELGLPDFDAEISDGWIVDLAVGIGRGALVLSVF